MIFYAIFCGRIFTAGKFLTTRRTPAFGKSTVVKNICIEFVEQFKDCNFNAACCILSNVLGEILHLNVLHEDDQPFYYFE